MAQTRILKDFKTSRTSENKISKKIFVKELIIGHHPISFKLLKDLASKLEIENNKEEVRLIHQFDFMSPFHSFSLEGIRGQVSGEMIKEFYPTLELTESNFPSKFYKDGEFREFGGRVKPHEIPANEQYFIQKAWKLAPESFWGEPRDYESFRNYHVKGLIHKIHKLPAADLGARENWQVDLTDGTAYLCENLWVTYNPATFLSYLDKEQCDIFSEGFYQFTKFTDVLMPLNVRFKLKGEISKERGTLFIPQSQTHEWGSFIIEFDSDHHLTALFFMNENESDNEEIAKKIKLLKRVLERVFVNFEKKITSESISFENTPVNYHLSDEVHGLTNYFPHLNIISDLGFIPLTNEKINSLQGLSRLIYLYKQSII